MQDDTIVYAAPSVLCSLVSPCSSTPHSLPIDTTLQYSTPLSSTPHSSASSTAAHHSATPPSAPKFHSTIMLPLGGDQPTKTLHHEPPGPVQCTIICRCFDCALAATVTLRSNPTLEFLIAILAALPTVPTRPHCTSFPSPNHRATLPTTSHPSSALHQTDRAHLEASDCPCP
jgi:hypothetical protein